MPLYTIQRTLLVIPTLIGITIISFVIMHLAPGDPADLFLGGAAGSDGISTEKRADAERVREELRRQLGLDQPVHIQYLTWISKVVFHPHPLTDYELGARAADRLLASLAESQREELSRYEGEERKRRFLELVPRDEARAISASTFWRAKRLKLVGNYEYAGAGFLLGHIGDRRLTTLDFGRSFKDQQPVIA